MALHIFPILVYMNMGPGIYVYMHSATDSWTYIETRGWIIIQ